MTCVWAIGKKIARTIKHLLNERDLPQYLSYGCDFVVYLDSSFHFFSFPKFFIKVAFV